MKNILHILLIFCFSLTIVSCGEKDEYESWEKKGNTPLSSPSDLTATSSAGRVALDWSAVTSAGSYTVYWDNPTGISSSSTAITSVSTDNYTHSSLDNGSTYFYRLPLSILIILLVLFQVRSMPLLLFLQQIIYLQVEQTILLF